MFETFLRYERFQFEPADYRPGLNWGLIVALVLNFGALIGIGVIAWRCFR